MAKDTVLGALIDFFKHCPVLTEETINADNLPEEAPEYCIYAVPCKPVVTAYVDGSGIYQYLFVVAGREIYGDSDDNLDNAEKYEEIVDWIEAENKAQRLPKLSDGKEAQKIEVLTNGYVFDNEIDKAQYQIQCRLKYYKEP